MVQLVSNCICASHSNVIFFYLLGKSIESTCTRCDSEATKKNRHTHLGKQNYYCNSCGSQFVESGKDWNISEVQQELINKFLYGKDFPCRNFQSL